MLKDKEKLIDFYKYYNKNQAGDDCAIVSLLNASKYLHGKDLILPGTKEYEEILDLTGCRAGAACAPEKAHPILKIEEKKQYDGWYVIDFTDLPLALNIWHSHYGFHSTLVIDYCKRNKAVQMLNFRQETTTDGWIFLEKLHYFIKTVGIGESGVARSYKKLEIK